jgi:hypothetical protein
MRKFILARVHYNGLFGALFKDNIENDLRDIENSNGFISTDSYHWLIRSVTKEQVDGLEVIIGKIVKIIPNQEYTTISEETKEERESEVNEVKNKESSFYICVSLNLAAFEVSKMVTINQIKKVLVAGFLKTGKEYELVIDYTYDDDRIIEKLNKFSSAKSANFKLVATNPHANDEFKPLDDQFQKSNVKNAQLTYRAGVDGKLDIKSPESIVRQSLMMAAAGYGSGTIHGFDHENKAYTLQLGNNLIDKIEISEDLENDIVISIMVERFKNKDRKNV